MPGSWFVLPSILLTINPHQGHDGHDCQRSSVQPEKMTSNNVGLTQRQTTIHLKCTTMANLESSVDLIYITLHSTLGTGGTCKLDTKPVGQCFQTQDPLTETRTRLCGWFILSAREENC